MEKAYVIAWIISSEFDSDYSGRLKNARQGKLGWLKVHWSGGEMERNWWGGD